MSTRSVPTPDEPRVLLFTLPLDCQPSLNAWRRWHWAVRARHQREVADAVLVATRTAGWVNGSTPLSKARVTAVFHFPSNVQRDPSNYSLKFVADALVACGVLVDDDFLHMEEVVRMGHVAKPGYIEIRVEETTEGRREEGMG